MTNKIAKQFNYEDLTVSDYIHNKFSRDNSQTTKDYIRDVYRTSPASSESEAERAFVAVGCIIAFEAAKSENESPRYFTRIKDMSKLKKPAIELLKFTKGQTTKNAVESEIKYTKEALIRDKGFDKSLASNDFKKYVEKKCNEYQVEMAFWS